MDQTYPICDTETASPSFEVREEHPRQWRKYAKIICHLRDDVALAQGDLPDSASIYYLVKKHYLATFDPLPWEDVVYRLLISIARDLRENADATTTQQVRCWLTFFEQALLQLRKATGNSYIWHH